MKRKELLMVDDVRFYLQLTKTVFSERDYIIHKAADGQQILDFARIIKPDLIILDLDMQGLEGEEVCVQLKSQPSTRSISVIMATSEPTADVRRRCFYAGCDDLLVKPIRLEALNDSVEKKLGDYERTFPRLDVVIPCLLDNGQDQILTNIYTLSAGGAFIGVDPPPIPGSDHVLTFFLPEEEEDISIRALARWNRLMPEKRPAGSGFEFVAAEEENLERLNKWATSAIDDPVFG